MRRPPSCVAFVSEKELTACGISKKTCSTQRDLQIFLKDKGLSREIQDALSAMLTQVLFVADPQGRGYYPAVSGYATLAYRKLDEANRHAFDEIHRHFFYFRHNDFWAQEAMKRLPCVVESTRMLVCAEDLGMVPPCVYGVLDHFKILSLEVQSMPKRNEGEFSRVEHNPHLSVDTITTHDMEPLRLWWKRYPETAQRYWWQRMQGWGKAPAELSGEDVEKILSQHLHSPSLLCIIALQDWLGMDECLRNPRVEEEQVNQPANPRHYWRYRMHITLESLLKAQVFNGRIRKILEQSERTFSECRAR